MRKITVNLIRNTIAQLCMEANFKLRPDVFQALKTAYKKEKSRRAKDIIRAIIYNADIVKRECLAICQDTGLPVIFIELGQDVQIIGGFLGEAINKGVQSGYKQAYLRNSIICDPIKRGKPGFMPAVIHYELVPGKNLKLTVLPKGFGCENKAQVKMFKPTIDLQQIKRFIVDVVKNAGPDACPPFVVGVGIGGTQDYACLLAKKALLRPLAPPHPWPSPHRGEGRGEGEYRIRVLEQDLLKAINRLNIGPMGLGGRTTALAVNIETYPTHIAGLPVCVNISCHALRNAQTVI